MYYMLGCFGPEDADATTICRIPQLPDVSWNSGTRITGRVPIPLKVDLDPEQPGVLLPMYHKGILVLSDEMIVALHEAGVDNLDLYDLVVHDPFTGKDRREYKAVNIVGVIACADLGKSISQAHGTPLIDVDFDRLVIDEPRARGTLMFRLAENVAGIVVHEKVKRHLEAKRIPYLDFDPPEDWIG